MNKFKEISSQFRPKIIKVLFIGESPPAKERFFFFLAPNADLYNFTKQAFEIAFKDCAIDPNNFLNFFKNLGCFLDDLCENPINHLDDFTKDKKRIASISSLATRIKEYNPVVIIAIMKKIRNHITKAINISGIKPKHTFFLGYPTRKKEYIDNYIYGLSEILKSLRTEKILD